MSVCRVLLLTSTFPPRGGSGVQRAYYQSELLSKLGHHVEVVTESIGNLWVEDGSFRLEYLAESQVHRMPVFSLLWSRLRNRIGKCLPFVGLYPDSHGAWVQGAVARARQVIERWR